MSDGFPEETYRRLTRLRCKVTSHDYRLVKYLSRDVILERCRDCKKERRDKKTFEYR